MDTKRKTESVKHLANEAMSCGCFCTGRKIEFCVFHSAVAQMYRALKVLTLTSKIVSHLKAVDPQAYKQALRAIAKAEWGTE